MDNKPCESTLRPFTASPGRLFADAFDGVQARSNLRLPIAVCGVNGVEPCRYLVSTLPFATIADDHEAWVPWRRDLA
ncbi:hypothetical protein HT746_07565 [Burkholderia pyrrocinia]|uniref:hypothetical protein n=1 Tax=Burkholderia pyrrocinia TaxID=60550 RepID=UPI001576E620|nr:hypothetical protein [Burkholderia pyrrocinia]NTX26992.1 hypothetical protein [Burkholderia pyrrocinia]